jgi:iron complex transport system substrate-binding protein
MKTPGSTILQLRPFHYGSYMRAAHGWLAFAAALFLAEPGFAHSHRVVSTFLCTDEYVFRLLPREEIAALSFEAGDRFPVVSTIADQVKAIRQIHPGAETVLDLKPDLVVMYQGTQAQLHAELLSVGVPVLDVPWANSLADVRKVTRLLGDRLGASEKAAHLLEDMDRDLSVARAAAPRAPVPALLYEANGYALSAGLTRELMRDGGLEDASASMGLNRLGQIPVESVVAHAPALLILNARETVRDARADLVLHHPAFASLAPRTLIVWQPLRALLCPGPWSVDAAWTFSDLANQTRGGR